VQRAGVGDLGLDSPPLTAAPERASLAFAAALGAGDLGGATACFARDACLVTPDGTAIHGREHIRAVLAQLIALRAEVAVEFSSVLVGGDVALARERWTIRSRGAEATPFAQTLAPSLVLRRIEAEWKLAIASPWAI
jgi:ketosteroid isomerase-like protein